MKSIIIFVLVVISFGCGNKTEQQEVVAVDTVPAVTVDSASATLDTVVVAE